MTMIKFSPLVASLAIALGAQAEIFPVPQNLSGTETAFNASAATYRLSGDGLADPAAVALLRNNLTITDNGSIEIVIGERGDASVSDVAANIPAQGQGYLLTTTPTKVTIAGSDEAGTFYGAVSFLQMLADGDVPAATVTDWPVNPVRGIIEGYYGNPWSQDDRLDMMTNLMPQSKMNIYIYGPKNDPYHRANWATEYPAEEAALISEVAKAGRENHVTFVWAMHPSNAITGDNLEKAKTKLEKMYDLGIRRFAIFFDDINANSVDDQIAYLNYLNKEVIKTHTDVGSLIVCPTQYNQSWAGGDYLSKMGSGLDDDIEIMWTGREVVDQKLGTSTQWFINQTGRKPFIWLNYPVNDYGYSVHPLLLSPYDPADANINEITTGFASNPMEFYEASKVALYGIGDFTWNPAAYDDWASWERALEFMMPDHLDAFRTYCYCNFYYPKPSHWVNIPYEETPDFKVAIDKHKTYTAETAADLHEFFTKQVAAGEELLGVTDSRLVNEIKEYIMTYTMQGQRGLLLADMRNTLDKEAPADFLKAYTTYKQLTDSSENCLARDFPGSIRSNRGNSGNQYVEPYITSTVNDLISEFQSAGYDYPAGLFPAQVIPTGKYRILYKERILSNGSGKAANTPSDPNFSTTEDDVNSERQVWNIKYNIELDRYSITSAFDERYINEKGVFGTNAYDANWNTYNIYGLNGKYAIQRAGSAGKHFWGYSGGKIKNDAGETYSPDRFIFDIVPVEAESVNDTVIILEEGVNYVISDKQGRVLMRASGGNALSFVERPEKLNSSHKFKLTRNANGRWEIRSTRSDKGYINEKGAIGSNAFSAEWNTYRIFEKNGWFAIQNWESAGEDYWFVNENAIGRKAMINGEAYNFRFENQDAAAIDEISVESPADDAVYDLQGRRVANPSHGIFIKKGKKFIL